jgi:hypothetical protein
MSLMHEEYFAPRLPVALAVGSESGKAATKRDPDHGPSDDKHDVTRSGGVEGAVGEQEEQGVADEADVLSEGREEDSAQDAGSHDESVPETVVESAGRARGGAAALASWSRRST